MVCGTSVTTTTTTITTTTNTNAGGYKTTSTSASATPLLSHLSSASEAVITSIRTELTPFTTTIENQCTSDAATHVPNLLKVLNDKLDRMWQDFQRQISDLNLIISQLLENHNKMQVESIKTTERLEQHIDSLERQLLADELVIDGVPISSTSTDADLKSVLDKLCVTINTPLPSIKCIYRLKRFRSNNTGPIVVKFNSVDHKIKLQSAVRKYIISSQRCLVLSDVGLNSGAKIYIHDRLTKHNYKLFRHTLKIKSQQNFYKVYTSNGIVFIICKKGDNPVKVANFYDLATITDGLDTNNSCA